MKKVCHITSVHGRYDMRIFQKECVSLAKAGYDVALLVNDELPEEKKDGVSIFPMACGHRRMERIRKASSVMYKKAMQMDAAVYHIHDPELLPLAKRLSKHGKKVVFDSHENYFQQIKTKKWIPKLFRHSVAFLYRIYESSVLSKIEAVVVPCRFNGKNIFDGIAKRTVFLDNLPISNAFTAADYEGKPHPLAACCPGSLTVSRGILETVKCSIETGTRIIIAGVLDESTKEVLTPYLGNQLLDFRGKVGKNEIQKIYDEAGIGLSLIHNTGQYFMLDNLPTKVYEFMLVGIPVIITRNAASEAFFSQYHAGILVDDGDEQQICEAIHFLKSHPEEAKRMGEEGRRIVIEEYCWETEEKKLLELYREII